MQLAGRVPGGAALADAAREALTTGTRYAVLVGMGLLMIGALFVWFRGASRTEEVLEDELDADIPPSLAPALSVPAEGAA